MSSGASQTENNETHFRIFSFARGLHTEPLRKYTGEPPFAEAVGYVKWLDWGAEMPFVASC